MKTYKISNTTFNYDVLLDDTLKLIIGYDENQKPIYKDVLKLHKYKFTYNDDGYISGCMSVLENEDWYGQVSIFEKEYGISIGYGCFKFVNGAVVYDKNKYDELKAIEEKQNEINELKAYLTSTDYIYNSIREGGRTEEYYADVIEQRKQARRRIQELEEELGI